jgi:endo-1,4-beta-D-glucanase Y
MITKYLLKVLLLIMPILSITVYSQEGATKKMRTDPVIPTLGAVESGVYRNMFVEAGYTQAQSDAKVNNAFQELFYGSNTNPNLGKCVYFPVNNDEAYIYAFDSQDVRTEGMSYAMMICVQLNKKAEFDRLWKWSYNNMRHATGARAGHFAWKCSSTGVKLDNSSASDGEEYFVTALFFAAKRWGNGTGIFNYQKQANDLLIAMQNKPVPVGGVTNFFDTTQKQVVFVPNEGGPALFTDPSYHLPAFYEVWKVAATTNNTFWNDVTTTSRNFFPTAAHPVTGLMPDYSNFNGTPNANFGANHAEFQFDAFRCIMNMAFDYAWYKKSDNEKVLSKKLHAFFTSKGPNYPSIYKLDGTENNSFGTFHSAGLVGCNAVGALASDNIITWNFIDDLYNINQPDGLYRYYDGMLYMLSLLHVSGNFKAYIPNNILSVNDIDIENLESYPNPVNDIYTISNKETIDAVEVVNVVGQVVLTKIYNTNTVSIDFSNFANGVYYIKVLSKNRIKNINVVKK